MLWYDVLAGIISAAGLWAFQVLLFMLYIRLSAKKKWNKNKRLYPYFSNNFVKRLFLLGLRGSVDITVIILTFIFNIITFLTVISGIGVIITSNLIVEYCFRSGLGIEIVCFLIRGALIVHTGVNL